MATLPGQQQPTFQGQGSFPAAPQPPQAAKHKSQASLDFDNFFGSR